MRCTPHEASICVRLVPRGCTEPVASAPCNGSAVTCNTQFDDPIHSAAVRGAARFKRQLLCRLQLPANRPILSKNALVNTCHWSCQAVLLFRTTECRLRSKIKATFSRALCDGGDAAVKLVPCAVKCHSADVLLLACCRHLQPQVL